MLRTMFGKATVGAFVSLAILAWASPANAGWRWHGSSGGSSGGAYYYAPGVDMTPADGSMPAPMMPAPGAAPGTAPAPGTQGAPAPAQTMYRRADGLLAVNVPNDAKIYVNGQATSSTG